MSSVMDKERALELANEWFDSTVAECRQLEKKYGLPLWGEEMTTINGRPVIHEVPLPEEYRQALCEWEKAREHRDVAHTSASRRTGGWHEQSATDRPPSG